MKSRLYAFALACVIIPCTANMSSANSDLAKRSEHLVDLSSALSLPSAPSDVAEENDRPTRVGGLGIDCGDCSMWVNACCGEGSWEAVAILDATEECDPQDEDDYCWICPTETSCYSDHFSQYLLQDSVAAWAWLEQNTPCGNCDSSREGFVLNEAQRLANQSDATNLAELINNSSGELWFNDGRNALQAKGCDKNLGLHIPLGERLGNSLRVQLKLSKLGRLGSSLR